MLTCVAFFLISVALPKEGDSGSGEVLQKAAQFQRSFRQKLLQGVSFTSHTSQRIEWADKPVDTHEVEIHYVFSHPCLSEECLSEKSRPDLGIVMGINERYAFHLEKQSPQSTWIVTKISTDDPKVFWMTGKHDGFSDLNLEEMFGLYIPVLDIEGIPLDRFFDQPGIHVDSIQAEEDARLRVAFHGHAQTPMGHDRVLGGTIWLLPEKSWSLAEYDVGLVSGAPQQVLQIIESGGDANSRAHRSVVWGETSGLPVPVSVVNRYLGDTEWKLPKVEIRWQFSDWTVKRFPTERFLLSHYGLPEPGLPGPSERSPQPFSWLLWANLLGLILIGLAGIIHYYRRRRSPDH